MTVMLTFFISLKNNFQAIWLAFIGVLGWLDTRLPQPVYKFYPLLLGLTAVTGISSQERERRFTWGAAGFAAGLFLASSGLLLLALYLTWTPVQAPYLDGVQGRYFLPLAPLALLWLPPIFSLKEKWYRIFTLGVFLVWAYLSYLSVVGLFPDTGGRARSGSYGLGTEVLSPSFRKGDLGELSIAYLIPPAPL
ncbi:MAG: hypothetical protein A2139_13830 [Desulfobacca sp. RBG_16_60_12]|nr:MAG: hypothetical protein A2139_13830 [Desulfobacca sp. RBG_16_60_12]